MKEDIKTKIIGRHQLMLEACQLLGREIPESTFQQALGKDLTEHAEILSEIERDEEFSISDLKVNYAPSSLDIYTRTLEIMSGGYKNYVLQSDPDLENRCNELLEKAKSRMLDLAEPEKKESTEKSLETMKNLSYAQRYLMMFELGTLLTKEEQKGHFDTTEVQKAWFIILLLQHLQDVAGIFTISPPDLNELKVYGSEVKKVAEKMLAANTISNDQFSEIHTSFEKIVDMVKRALQGEK
ncbi:MAG: hypothetical protein HKM07_05735 [Chlamydiae bacterium]|nr:hypothetical protein [Chlamydiota bacterium]